MEPIHILNDKNYQNDPLVLRLIEFTKNVSSGKYAGPQKREALSRFTYGWDNGELSTLLEEIGSGKSKLKTDAEIYKRVKEELDSIASHKSGFFRVELAKALENPYSAKLKSYVEIKQSIKGDAALFSKGPHEAMEGKRLIPELRISPPMDMSQKIPVSQPKTRPEILSI